MNAQIGDVVVRRWTDPETLTDKLFIDRADPISRVSAELLQEISVLTERGEDRWSTLDGDVLTIKADNRTVVYRVDFTSYDAATDSYLMRWPD